MSNTFYVCPASSHSKSAEVEAPPSPIHQSYIHLLVYSSTHLPTHQSIIHIYVHLLIWLSSILSTHPSTHHSRIPSVHPFTHHSFIHHSFIYTSICVLTYPSACPSTRQSIIQIYPHLPTCLSAHASIHPPPHLHMPSSTHSSTHLSIHPCFCHSSNCSSIDYTSTNSSIH